MHSLSYIKSVCIRPKLVASYFYLCTTEIFRKLTSVCIHFFSDPALSVCRINCKLHNLCNAFRMMQLFLESQIQNTNYMTITFANQTIIVPIAYLILIDCRKSIKRKPFAFHSTN